MAAKKAMIIQHYNQYLDDKGNALHHEPGEQVSILEEVSKPGTWFQWYKVRLENGAVVEMSSNMVRAYSKSGLTPLQERDILDALKATWDAIGGDILEAVGIGYHSGKTMPRSHVMEVVADADHVRAHGMHSEAAEWFYHAPDAVRRRLLREAFPSKRYGY